MSLVESNCDPLREAEFNEWCDTVQVPAALETPGYVAARRLRVKEFRDGRGKYLVIHEIETGDIEQTVRLRSSRPAVERPGLERPVVAGDLLATDHRQSRGGDIGDRR